MPPAVLPDAATIPPPAVPRPSKGQNHTIQGLRGFSALCVILYHLHNMGVDAGFVRIRYAPFAQTLISGTGHFGVMLFFMISGYLIVRSLVHHTSIAEFWKLRIARIYPVFLCLHLIMFTAGPLLRYEWMANLSAVGYALHFVSNLLFLPGVFPLPIAQKNAWSLSYEFAFYALSSLLFFALRETGKGNGRFPRVAALVAGAVGTVLFLYRYPAAWFFVVGVLLYFAERRFLAHVGKIVRVPWGGGAALLSTFVLFASAEAGMSYLYPVTLFFGCIFFATVVGETGLFSAFLRTRPLQYLGKISYSFYLIHPFVLDPLRSLSVRYAAVIDNETVVFFLFVVVGLLLTTAISALSFRFIESGLPRRRT